MSAKRRNPGRGRGKGRDGGGPDRRSRSDRPPKRDKRPKREHAAPEPQTPPAPVDLPGPSHYELIDSGDQMKLERFGPVILARPAAAAIWPPALSPADWQAADAHFSRKKGGGWDERQPLPPAWLMDERGMKLKLSTTDFGHLGVFPEQRFLWQWLEERVAARIAAKPTADPPTVLNLFAYSGAATVALARAGAEVCHLDAARGMVAWARENADLNGLSDAPIRWIVDDALKFIEREQRRGRRYDGIVLHPPSFGRGPKGEIFKIEDAIVDLLARCRALLSDSPLLIALAVHTPELTPVVVHHLLQDMMHGQDGQIAADEMLCTGAPDTRAYPNGVCGRWWAPA